MQSQLFDPKEIPSVKLAEDAPFRDQKAYVQKSFEPSKQLELGFFENYYDKFAKRYYDAEKSGEFFFQSNIQMPAIQRLLECGPARSVSPPKFSTVLDVGCGTGLYSRYFLDMNKKVTGIDLSREMLKYAMRTSPNAKFIHSDFFHYDFSGEEFDLVFASFLFGYVDDLDAFFHRAKKVLAKGGSIIASMLHPYRIHDRLRQRSSSLPKSIYYSDFLDSDQLLPLRAHTHEDISEAAWRSNLKSIFIAPKPIREGVNCNQDEKFDLYEDEFTISLMYFKNC